jgi:hypothetical protein
VPVDSESAAERVRQVLVELDGLLDAFDVPGSVAGSLARVTARVRRDLLPRLEDPPDFAVAGIVGPNNSGKSTLFSAIAGEGGRVLSPASPTGGFTRVLVGATNPGGRASAGAGLGRRFEVEALGDAVPDEARVHRSADPHRLLLVDAPALPERLVLVDTPDFDSVFTENREAGDALLVTADLLVLVVTPQTYQNLGVVEFLRRAVAGGRPFVLVYNEGAAEDVARRHLDKLAADLGRRPLARFFAPHDLAVQDGAGDLVARALDGEETGDLRAWLLAGAWIDVVLRDAWIASARALVADLAELEEGWEAGTRGPLELYRAMDERIAAYARTVTQALFPLAPFRDALQAALDRRSSLHRALRYVPETVGGFVRSGYDSLRRAFRDDEQALTSAERFREAERAALVGDEGGGARRRALLRLWEALAGDVHARPGAVVGDAAAHDFSPAARASLGTRLIALHADAPLPFQDFRAECERSIDLELDGRGEEAGLQWAYTGLKLLPPVTAVAVMALTGVVGDVSAGVAWLATEPFLHKAVGREFVARIHDAWSQRRSRELADLLACALAPRCMEELKGRAEGYRRAADQLTAVRSHLEELLP